MFLRSLSNTAAGTLRARDCVLHRSAQLLAEAMLEADLEATAGRSFDRLLGVFVEGVASQPASMRIEVSRVLTKSKHFAWVRVLSSLLERGEGGVSLEALSESNSAFGSEIVVLETASTKKCLLFCQGALTEKQTSYVYMCIFSCICA